MSHCAVCGIDLGTDISEHLVTLRLQDMGYLAQDEQYRCPRCGWMWWGGMEVAMDSAPPYFKDYEGKFDDERKDLYISACWNSTLEVRSCKVCGSPMELHKVSPAATFLSDGAIGNDPMRHELYERMHFYGVTQRFTYIVEHILFQLKCTNKSCKWVREMTL